MRHSRTKSSAISCTQSYLLRYFLRCIVWDASSTTPSRLTQNCHINKYTSMRNDVIASSHHYRVTFAAFQMRSIIDKGTTFWRKRRERERICQHRQDVQRRLVSRRTRRINRIFISMVQEAASLGDDMQILENCGHAADMTWIAQDISQILARRLDLPLRLRRHSRSAYEICGWHNGI